MKTSSVKSKDASDNQVVIQKTFGPLQRTHTSSKLQINPFFRSPQRCKNQDSEISQKQTGKYSRIPKVQKSKSVADFYSRGIEKAAPVTPVLPKIDKSNFETSELDEHYSMEDIDENESFVKK